MNTFDDVRESLKGIYEEVDDTLDQLGLLLDDIEVDDGEEAEVSFSHLRDLANQAFDILKSVDEDGGDL